MCPFILLVLLRGSWREWQDWVFTDDLCVLVKDGGIGCPIQLRGREWGLSLDWLVQFKFHEMSSDVCISLIRTEVLTDLSGNDRHCPCYPSPAIRLNMWNVFILWTEPHQSSCKNPNRLPLASPGGANPLLSSFETMSSLSSQVPQSSCWLFRTELRWPSTVCTG